MYKVAEPNSITVSFVRMLARASIESRKFENGLVFGNGSAIVVGTIAARSRAQETCFVLGCIIDGDGGARV
jgi:hypothetical protein